MMSILPLTPNRGTSVHLSSSSLSVSRELFIGTKWWENPASSPYHFWVSPRGKGVPCSWGSFCWHSPGTAIPIKVFFQHHSRHCGYFRFQDHVCPSPSINIPQQGSKCLSKKLPSPKSQYGHREALPGSCHKLQSYCQELVSTSIPVYTLHCLGSGILLVPI